MSCLPFEYTSTLSPAFQPRSRKRSVGRAMTTLLPKTRSWRSLDSRCRSAFRPDLPIAHPHRLRYL